MSVENVAINRKYCDILCRLCLKKENLVEIYRNIKKRCFNKEIELYFERNYIQIDPEDGLPNYICDKCIEVLNNWHTFKEKCSRNYEALSKLKTEAEDKVLIKSEDVISSEDNYEPDKRNESESELDEAKNDLSPIEKVEVIIDDANTQKRTIRKKKTLKVEENSSADEVKGTRRKKKKKYMYVKQCPICGVLLKYDIKAHLLIHNTPDGRPFKCDQCDKTFRRKENMREHFQRDHLMIRYTCEVCSKVCTTKDNLNLHLKIHKNEKQYKCDQCEKSFNSNKYLYKHKKGHTGIKNFVCSYCGKAFRVGECLKEHIRIHTGERPHLCKVCGKDFRTANHLRQHNRVHTGAQPFKCQECSMCYGNKKSLDSHKKTHLVPPTFILHTPEIETEVSSEIVPYQ